MATMEDSATDTASQPKTDLNKTLDWVAKAAVITATLLYGCGFIVVSLHQYTYGVVETAPFRPKVLAAGMWFLGFVAIPFVLVREGIAIKFKYMSAEREKWLRRQSTYFFFLMVSCFWLGLIVSLAFDTSATYPLPSIGTIFIAMVISAAVVALDGWNRVPHWITVSAVLFFVGLNLYCGMRDYAHEQPSAASIGVWFFVGSSFASSEMKSRSLTVQVGNWKQSFALAMAAITAFATIIYPHIRPSWGGGAPLPATIYLAKDAIMIPGRNVSAKILEESDSGFYVVGANDKKATFIPRSQVALVYYSDDSAGPFILKSK